MLLTDLPQSVLFLLFLLISLVIGNYPAWKKGAAKLRQLLERRKPSQKLDARPFKKVQPQRPSVSQASGGQLNSYEALVFGRLAQGESKGLSRRQLSADLHLGGVNIKKTLLTLDRRGLVRVTVTPLLSIRFSLSEKGRKYSLELGIVPNHMTA